MPHSGELGAGLLQDSSEVVVPAPAPAPAPALAPVPAPAPAPAPGELPKRPSNLSLAICAVVVAVLVQLALLIALLSVESTAADVAAAAAGGGATTGGAARTYCTISATSTSRYGNHPNINADVNAALQDGCTLVGGLGVGHGYGGGIGDKDGETTFGQALMCASGTGCAK
eukprot:COSAG06_NODE_315_length_17722_cov_10.903535_10_plen_171_part_00